jgi:hypothetical protein
MNGSPKKASRVSENKSTQLGMLLDIAATPLPGATNTERMILIPPPRWTGESEEHREITWERIAAE